MPIPCDAPIPIVIDVSVLDIKTPTLSFSLKSAPPNTDIAVSPTGHLYFDQQKVCIQVTMEFTDGSHTFYKGNAPDNVPKDALAFSDTKTGQKYPFDSGNSSLKEIALVANNGANIVFNYLNTDNCGKDKESDYGIYIGDSTGNYLVQYDPIISNGGNGDNLTRTCPVHSSRRHHR